MNRTDRVLHNPDRSCATYKVTNNVDPGGSYRYNFARDECLKLFSNVPPKCRTTHMLEAPEVIFFDLGDTLGTAVLSAPPVHLVEFDVFHFVPQLLRGLKDQGLRLGIISNTGDDGKAIVDGVLAASAILDFFDEGLRLYSREIGLQKDSPAIFTRAAEIAGLGVKRCMYAGENAAERAFARDAGMRVCPHPLLIREVLAGESLRYVRVTVPTARVSEAYSSLRQLAFVPLHVADLGGRVVYGITSQRVAAELANMLFQVDLLGEPDAPNESDLYLLRDDLAKNTGFLSTDGSARRFFAGHDGPLLLSATAEGLVVALPPGRSPGEFHFAEARHGHTLRMMPDPLLLEPASGGAAPGFQDRFEGGLEAAVLLSDTERGALSRIAGDMVLNAVERYSGLRSLSPNDPRPIKSRHIADENGDNRRAVMVLAHDLQAAGQGRLNVRLVQFSHRGLTLHNVEAELPGVSPELVLVTAHLDSTAANDPHYDEAHGSAPGADDDASGVAAVLLAAQCFASLAAAAPPARTIRFVLFNAEEEGLVGSRVYARQQRARQAPIVAVYQMDMIGYHERPPRSWEVHAGYSQSAEVEARSLALARVLRQVTSIVSPALELPQIYASVMAGDPAAGRSDHAPFQAQGYAACVVSEDFFAGPDPDSPAPQPNPNYHRAGDTTIVPDFAAEIARAVAAAAWVVAKATISTNPPQFAAQCRGEDVRMTSREIDTGSLQRATRPALAADASTSRLLRFDGVKVAGGSAPPEADVAGAPATKSLASRAIAIVRTERARAAGFTARRADESEFIPDPVNQTTSSAAQVVHLQQFYRGLPVFRTSQTVRFSPQGQDADLSGNSLLLETEIDASPKILAREAVLVAARHLAVTAGRQIKDEFGELSTEPPFHLEGYEPTVIAGFEMLPTNPTVLDWVASAAHDPAASKEKPFSRPIPAHLLVFDQPAGPRLGWYSIFTREKESNGVAVTEQYAVIVSADAQPGEILYSRDMMHKARASGNVFEFSPGIAGRIVTEMPRAMGDYPVMPSIPLTGFPADWVEMDKTIGNSTMATLNFTSNSLSGVPNGALIEFNPGQQFGDDQKLLNIFYFCNYMHDFLYILGFDEVAGNFQRINFTHLGVGGDPVRARAHSGAVNGTANMSTAADGQPPVMNMGLVTSTGRHTAFDADVVFHEYTHGLTNRLVGGTRQGHTLDAPQSEGMGEGWSDFFALTIQNYFRAQRGQPEKFVTGDWVVNQPVGIRTHPYDDRYPDTYGNVSTFPRNPDTGLPDEHRTGEIWCAALMMMVRRIRAALGSDTDGYRLGWQMVVDGLKLTPANPTFLQARDAILLALDQMLDQRRIPQATHRTVRQAAQAAFGRFGMGPNARCDDAGVDGIVEDIVIGAVA
jgi:Fungalysin metallopeptidase (M36)/Peptidase family M28